MTSSIHLTTPDRELDQRRGGPWSQLRSDTGKVVGVAYWDPILIGFGDGADPSGWVVGGDVAVEDTTFFDYGSPHRALTSLTAFRTW